MCNDQPQGDFRYVEMWGRHIQLFWSRLQTATAIQIGVVVGWYFLISEKTLPHSAAAFLLSVFGLVLLFQVHGIMEVDSDYIDAIADKAGDYFPGHETSRKKKGRKKAFIIILSSLVFTGLLIAFSLFAMCRFKHISL